MIDKNEKDPRPEKNRILRAKDIIPGAERAGGPDEKTEGVKFDIPRFNLAQDIMSAQRRQMAVRRKGPETEEGRRKTEDRGPDFAQGATPGRQRAEDGIQNTEYRTQNAEQRIKKTEWRPAGGIETLRNSIIAEIVARDIERLCAGHRRALVLRDTD